ncbi:MAG: hypothetical protein RL111_310 [Pseudomonadota bacterium]|jgi:Ca-activated chloride channel family protein
MLEWNSVHLQWGFMLWGFVVLLPVLAWVGWSRRNGVALVWVLGLSVLMLALCRPRATVSLPVYDQSLMIVLDVSGSMRANDVKPSRIEVATDMVRQFIDRQPAHVKLGIVLVSSAASVVQVPTQDREALHRAIEQLPLQPGSALGTGVLVSLKQLAPDVKLDAAAILRGEWPPAASLKASDAAGHAAIVMITDGQGNLGPNLNDMAKLTQVLGLKIYTLGVGTPEGAVLKAEGIQARVKLDEAPLQQVAEITGGEYFRAASGKDIGRLYDSLRIRLAAGQLQLMELTAPVAALGLLLVVMASAWNLARQGRIL